MFYFNSWDYMCVGSNGFAQVGSPDYLRKSDVEMKFILHYIRTNFPVPLPLQDYAGYRVKSFAHDFGTYHELIVKYNRRKIEEWECSEKEEENALDALFWEWFGQVESIDLETEEITEQIKQLYLASLDKEKAEHLRVEFTNFDKNRDNPKCLQA